MPKVSVIMSVYNQEGYLHDSINSILSQSFKDFEFIIVNDGSKDNSASIIESFTDKRIKFINNDFNSGLISCLNSALIDGLNSEYVARMDSDDIAFNTRFEEQIRVLDSRSQIGLLGTGVKYFGSNLKSFKKYPPTEHRKLISTLLCQNPFYHPTMMIRSKVLIDNNIIYSKDFPKYDDYSLWADLIGTCEFANIPKILLSYRRHDQNEGAFLNSHADIDLDSFKRVLNKICLKIGIYLNERQRQILGVISSRTRATIDTKISLQEIEHLIAYLVKESNGSVLDKSYLSFKMFERAVLYLLVSDRKQDAIKLLSHGNIKNGSKLVWSYLSRRD